MKVAIILVAVFFIGSFMAPHFLCAQTWDEKSSEIDADSEILSDQQDAQREMDTKIYGRVTGVDPDRNIVSLVPTKWVDDGTNMGKNDRYFVESDANFTGRSSLNEISVGDYITINYYVFGGLNRATDIIFEKEGGEGENPSGSGETGYDVQKALVD